MNNQKICFIMCSNDEFLANECLLYIQQLNMPEAFSIETKVIYGAESMASGYNKAMQESDAKYKVYLHQDVLLINREFITDILSLFTSHPEIGMLGVVGNKSLPPDGCPWSDGMGRRIGELYSDLIYRKEYCVFSKIKGDYQETVVLDGLLMATQYDLPWREDLFGGWDFYDCSQSLEFWKAGYQVVVPHMETPWVLHDNDLLHLQEYEKWRVVFEREYKKYYKDWPEGKKKFHADGTKKVIYQKFKKGSSPLNFPYPPVYQEKDTAYLCFTDHRELRSKFWKVIYIEDLTDFDEKKYLSVYQEQYELEPNQIQIGPLFSADTHYNPVITVPSLEEIPGTAFHKELFVPTADQYGKYIHKKNPVYQNGRYDGRPLLLTIGVPVSNQIESIGRCLAPLKPLLEKLDSELLVMDTGSTDGTLEVCKAYGARIIEYPWCDNMSAVRNEGLYHAKGAWYLSVDDDEWFENVEDILGFFQSGMYRKCDTATYIQRNYTTLNGETYSDNHTLRMAKITPELHFEGRIHDSLIVPANSKNCQLFSYAHHYGFVNDDRQKVKQKYLRNTSILLYDVYEYPANLRYNFQLGNEMKSERYSEAAEAYFFRGIAIEKEVPDKYFGRLHVVNLLSALYEAMDKRIFSLTALLEKTYDLTLAEKAYINYNQAALALRFRYPAKEILKFYQEYESFRKKYEKNPYESQLNTYIGLHVCTNPPYIMDAHAIAFCAYAGLNEVKNACRELDKIVLEDLLDQRHSVWEYAITGEESIYGSMLKKLSPQQYELYLEELTDALFVSICRDEIEERQLKRLEEVLTHFSIQGIRQYLQLYYKSLTEKMRNILYEFSMKRIPDVCTVQELFFCGYILKYHYISCGKEHGDMELFQHYIRMEGAFAAAYYHPELLKESSSTAVTADVRAAYYISQVLQTDGIKPESIAALKQALKLFPGFKQEIKKLLEILTHNNNPQMNEMRILKEQLMSQAEMLIKAGMLKEARKLLDELNVYFPDDKKMLQLRNQC